MVIISGLYWMKCAFLFRFLLVENREKENRQNRNRERERLYIISDSAVVCCALEIEKARECVALTRCEGKILKASERERANRKPA